MNGFVDFKKEQRLLSEAEQRGATRPVLSAVPTGTANTKSKSTGQPIWEEGETRIGIDNEGEFILENPGIPQSRAAGKKKTKLFLALAATAIGVGGVGYFKFFRSAEPYNSVALSGQTEPTAAPVEPVFNPIAAVSEPAAAASEPVKAAEAVITEQAIPDAHSALTAPIEMAIVEPVAANNEAEKLQASEIQQLRVDLTKLEVAVSALQERLTVAAAVKRASASPYRTERKVVHTLNPNGVVQAPPVVATVAEANPTPVATVVASKQRNEDAYPNVLGVDMWDGKPSVVVGAANGKEKPSYKVYSAGDRVDGMELRQADANSGTVVLSASGNSVRVKAGNATRVAQKQ